MNLYAYWLKTASPKTALWCLLCGLLASCSVSAPRQIDNICVIFEEKSRWYKQAARASKRWNVPIAVNMAIMKQESRFVSKAKPARSRILWLFPGPRKSNAYGYSQAKKETWNWYKREANHRGADRNDFDDAIDFIAWYNHISVKKIGIRSHDAFSLYLAYHEGHTGFKRRTYYKKAWLKKIAGQVQATANAYSTQLKKCEKKLAR